MMFLRLLIAFLFVHSLAYGQHSTYNAKVQHLNVHDGLSDEFITSLIKTKDSQLWVGTRDGLNRFDGFRFHEYNSLNSNLKTSSILKMILVENDLLVVQTKLPGTVYQSSGLYLYDRHQDMFFPFEDEYGALPFTSDRAKILQNNQRKLIVMEKEGPTWLFDFEAKVWREVVTPPEFDNISEYLYVLLKQDYPTARRILSPNFNMDFGISHFTEAFAYNPTYALQWIAEGRELIGINQSEVPISFSSGEESLVFPREIRALEDDDNGLIYVGTENGLYIVSIEPTLFKTYLSSTPDTSAPMTFEGSCRGISVYDSTLYVNQVSGMYSQSLRADRSVSYTPSQERLFPQLLYRDKYLFFGRNSLLRLTLASGEIDTIYAANALGIPPLWSLFIKDDDYFLGTHLGLVVMDSMSLYSGRQDFGCGTDTSYLSRRVYHFHEFQDGRIAFLTSNGLYIKFSDQCDPVSIPFVYENGVRASFTQFSHLLENKDSTLWVTTLDGGIVLCHLQDSVAVIEKQMNRDSGSPTNTFYAFYMDSLSGKWISTDLGLMHLRQDWTYRMYTSDDGLPANEFNRISHFKAPDGSIYFGGLNGVVGFHPKDFYQLKSTAPRLRILRINQFSGWEDRIMDVTKAVDSTGKIRFRSGDKFLEFQVGLNDFFDTENHKYEYRFANLDERWESMHKNILRVNVLPYGHHKLEFRGRNAAGVFATETITLSVHAMRPFYLTWWFFTLIGIGVLLIFREFLMQRARRIKGLEKVVRQRTHELEKQAEALRVSQAARSRFFANVSHELRTPLTLIKAPIQRLLSSSDLAEKDKRYLDIVQDSAKVLHHRIDDLLSLSQADAGQLKVQQNHFRLSTFLDRLSDNFAGIATEKGISLEVNHLLNSSLAIQADERKIWQILSNFISNALKFSPASSVVALNYEIKDQALVFSVEDKGPGIAADDLRLIFDRFYQVSESDQTSEGIGLGLALSKELAQAMQGQVWVESEKGAGSTFYLRIPFIPTSKEEEPQQDKRDKREDIATASGDKTVPASAPYIWLVEDNTAMREFLMSELYAFRVQSYVNGRDALSALQKKIQTGFLPDLIISDVMMPVMDGFEMLKNIKDDEALSGIPIIMLTARVGAEDKLRGLRMGVDDYITKPFNSEELIVRINNLVARAPAKREAAKEEESIVVIDQEWLARTEAKIKALMGQRNFTVAQLAFDLHISERQLYRKLKAYTGLSPNKYVREVRLCHAKDLLESGQVSTVAMLSASVGFEDPDYFSKLYFDRWGHRPIERMK